MIDLTAVNILMESLSPLSEKTDNNRDGLEGEEIDDDPKARTRIVLKNILHKEYCLLNYSEQNTAIFSCIVHASIQREAAEKNLWRTKSSAMCAMRCAVENFPRELYSKLPTKSDNQFSVQSAARSVLCDMFYKHSIETRKEEYDLLGVKVPASYNADASNGNVIYTELARDAMIHCIKMDSRIALTEVIQFVSVILMEEGVHNDETATGLIADALNWLADGEYISYNGNDALCNAKYA